VPSRALERPLKQANQHDRAVSSRRGYPAAMEKAPVEAGAKFLHEMTDTGRSWIGNQLHRCRFPCSAPPCSARFAGLTGRRSMDRSPDRISFPSVTAEATRTFASARRQPTLTRHGRRIPDIKRSCKSIRLHLHVHALRIVAEAVAFLGDVSDAGKCEVIREQAGLVLCQHGEHFHAALGRLLGIGVIRELG
jgi:hypothetical protein